VGADSKTKKPGTGWRAGDISKGCWKRVGLLDRTTKPTFIEKKRGSPVFEIEQVGGGTSGDTEWRQTQRLAELPAKVERRSGEENCFIGRRKKAEHNASPHQPPDAKKKKKKPKKKSKKKQTRRQRNPKKGGPNRIP